MDYKVYKSVKEIVTNLVKRAEEAINDGYKALTGNTTQDDIESSYEKSHQAGDEVSGKASTTANDEIKNELERRGVPIPEPPSVNDISDKASRVRDALPKFSLAAKAAGLAITAMVVGVVGLFVSISGNEKGRQIRNIVNQRNLHIAQAELHLKLTVSTEEFIGMMNGLNIPNIPPTVLVLPAVPVAAPSIPYIPPPMAMPSAVEAIEQEPMEIEVDNDGKTYTGTTTVGQVYRTIPQARPEIETHVGTIIHEDWDPWNGHLHEILNPHEHDGQQHQVNIDVDAGFASAHFHKR